MSWFFFFYLRGENWAKRTAVSSNSWSLTPWRRGSRPSNITWLFFLFPLNNRAAPPKQVLRRLQVHLQSRALWDEADKEAPASTLCRPWFTYLFISFFRSRLPCESRHAPLIMKLPPAAPLISSFSLWTNWLAMEATKVLRVALIATY